MLFNYDNNYWGVIICDFLVYFTLVKKSDMLVIVICTAPWWASEPGGYRRYINIHIIIIILYNIFLSSFFRTLMRWSKKSQRLSEKPFPRGRPSQLSPTHLSIKWNYLPPLRKSSDQLLYFPIAQTNLIHERYHISV